MPWSKLDIINLALNRLNKHSVNTTSAAGEFADSANRTIEMLYPSQIAGFSWRFATVIQQLSVLPDAPAISTWQYVMQLPSNYLAAVRTYPRVAFQIYEDVIYTNFNPLLLEYRFLPDYTHLPAYFVHYFSVLLAAWFADAVANNDSIAKTLANEANTLRGQALFVDSQSHPTPSMVSSPLIDVRGGGGVWGNGVNGQGYGWD